MEMQAVFHFEAPFDCRKGPCFRIEQLENQSILDVVYATFVEFIRYLC